MPQPVEVSSSVAEANRERAACAPPGADDFEDATRGHLAVPPLPAIPSRVPGGRPVWDFAGYAFLHRGDTPPPSVDPHLWRRSRLAAIAGLFLVARTPEHAIYQVRGYDLSHMTIVESTAGILVLDPLASHETAQHALRLYRETTGSRKSVIGVVYTHSGVDHFGGVRGLFDERGGEVPDIPVIAPDGFLEQVAGEHVHAGPAVARRAAYTYAAGLDKNPYAQAGSGPGLTRSTGEVTLIPPTVGVGAADHGPVERDQWSGEDAVPWRPGLYRQVVGGIRIVAQRTPRAAAPAAMNLYFPQLRALCMADGAPHTPLGGRVRDAHAWSRHLTETAQSFAGHTEVAFAAHHWPVWGEERITEFLSVQRDVYAYLNDQTLRLINGGGNGPEIAEELRLPAALADHWYTRGRHGPVSQDVTAVHQRHLGWFDGNPAHLWPYPQAEAGRRYVEVIGGPEAVVSAARKAYREGDPRWAAELLNHVIFGCPERSGPARRLQTKALSQLGYGAGDGAWRNLYLGGARELATGVARHARQETGDLVRNLSVEQYFAAVARRIDGPRAADEQRSPIVLRWRVTGTPERECTTTLRNGVLVHVPGRDLLAGTPQATITLSRAALDGLCLNGPDFRRNFTAAVERGEIALGSPDHLPCATTVFAYVTAPDPWRPLAAPPAPRQAPVPPRAGRNWS
ncbi:alkyl/aryl-sulfatase [Streptomyces spectabilis]|uniref:Alkyl sulfatase BDS1-like metallo-beta-lactamase superfamily hydrolase n=1 Tax=Streptomyces spectabilis TaxID=68270 RepID=A0A5P2WYY7_STRST|nr:alkyl sulfatase dimerization domain-containing protein [Streptomyces spectabilis]MBB5101199.1 alkyl sulfatase BDS1-like metallo-beta-lactamase superfamily hydrolase [Streptomyces spectabilis]MCI3900401.1 MBL fold metallo-hydrolase [Streptomyces spectabilis]QEV57983.1 MBL fold metallo-hydrolase [Streptomyces spectabilis]GGV09970.1 beta-lactamase-like protein [Streptomyces spectabilis]